MILLHSGKDAGRERRKQKRVEIVSFLRRLEHVRKPPGPTGATLACKLRSMYDDLPLVEPESGFFLCLVILPLRRASHYQLLVG